MSNKQNRAQSSMTVTLKIEIDAPDLGESNKTELIVAFAQLLHGAAAALRSEVVGPSSSPPANEPSGPTSPAT